MKRVFQHPSEPQGGKKYWRSLDELAGTAGFEAALKREFPQGAEEFNGGEVSRRHFMKIMGASTALAGIGLSGCRRPEMHLVPFTKSAEWTIPGKALFYTSSRPTPRGYVPVIVSTYEGRPTKIEGNQFHPINSDGHGGTDLYTQASVLNMYDPDRARFFKEHNVESNEANFVKFLDKLVAAYSASQGDGLAFLMEADPSPTRERLRAAGQAKVCRRRRPGVFMSRSPATQVRSRDGRRSAPAPSCGPLLDKADVVLALDSDFLGAAEGTIEGIKGFSKKRRVDQPGEKMNRLYMVENRYTITGGMADHRLRIPASQVRAFAVQARGGDFATATGDATLGTYCADARQDQGAGDFPGRLGRGTGEGPRGQQGQGAGARRVRSSPTRGASAWGLDQFGARRARQYADVGIAADVSKPGVEDRASWRRTSRRRKSPRSSSSAATRVITRRPTWSGPSGSSLSRRWSASAITRMSPRIIARGLCPRRITSSTGATAAARTAPTWRCSR